MERRAKKRLAEKISLQCKGSAPLDTLNSLTDCLLLYCLAQGHSGVV